MNHIAYPSIEQFRNAVRNVSQHTRYMGRDADNNPIYDPLKPLPTLSYIGTCKTHGTNGCVRYNKETKELGFQSRTNIITLENDNAGFVRFFEGKRAELDYLFSQVPGNEVLIFGEFVGKSINKGVAVNELSKRFIIFDVLSDGKWLSRPEIRDLKCKDVDIYNIYDFATYSIEIDFNEPEKSQNKLVELTTHVADECPVGKAFGVSGIGEGLVWRSISDGYTDPKFFFKCKDERHQNSHVKTLKPVDTDKIAALKELAAKVTPVWRLEQMLTEVCNLNNGGVIDRKHLGNYLQAINKDILKEDKDLVGGDLKEIAKYVGEIAKNFFFAAESKDGLK